ncbi:MAG: amidohydrolase family-domain-containing protein [Monoraphidium minutum]|nr:MAG: amidohydrolase family-domain-containing protein [Monoraphidium minutum]
MAMSYRFVALAAVPAKVYYGVGSKAAAVAAGGAGAQLVDLRGRTLLPGFVDSHGRVLLAAHTLMNTNLEGVKDIPELQARLRAHAATLPAGAWIEGMGYRSPQMREGRHPTKEELDAVSSTIPIDGSGHHGAGNSALLKAMKFGPDTPDPEGGVIYRKAGSKEPDGHLAEAAVMMALATKPALSKERAREGVRRAVKTWLENGYTTANEQGLGLAADDADIARLIIDEKLLPLDLVVYAKYSAALSAAKVAAQISEDYPAKQAAQDGPRYVNRVRAEGVKFWMDGSIPTALRLKPYAKNPVGVTDKDYKGVQVDPTKDVETTTARFWKNGTVQIAAHALGDGAIEVVLRAMEKAYKAQGPTAKRHALQHAAMITPGQVARIAKLGVIPSFTPGSIYLIGDYITELHGKEVHSFTKLGVPWTINTDYPAGAGPNALLSVQDIVNRATKAGRVLGPEQRVSPYEALKGLTINGAYLHNEEKRKGTIQVGKLADLVIVDKNPLKVPKSEIMDIKVLETIKEGRSVYRRPQDALPPPPLPKVKGDELELDDTSGFVAPKLTPGQQDTLGELFAGGKQA